MTNLLHIHRIYTLNIATQAQPFLIKAHLDFGRLSHLLVMLVIQNIKWLDGKQHFPPHDR